jgi:Holliday junction resolvase
MSARERDKGLRAENEVVAILRQHGWHGAARNLLQARSGGADVLGTSPLCVEVKRTERSDPWAWWAQVTAAAKPGEIPCVAFRRSGAEWLALTSFEELLILLEHRALERTLNRAIEDLA